MVNETEAMAVEVEAVDFPEVGADRKYATTLRDAVAEEVLVPVVGAPTTGCVFDRFPRSSGMTRLVSTPLWSLRPFMCPLWLTIGKAALSEMRVKWYADDIDAYASQEERRSSWRRAKRGGVVACGVVAGVASYLDRFPLAMDTPVYHVPEFDQLMMILPYRVMVVSWLSVLAAAVLPTSRLSYSNLEH